MYFDGSTYYLSVLVDAIVIVSKNDNYLYDLMGGYHRNRIT